MKKFWIYLMILTYRRLSAYEKEKTLPDGIPGIRDTTAECKGYTPRKLKADEVNECIGDEHYLCRKCAFYVI